MEIPQERPYVVCHMVSAINGKINGEFFGEPAMLPVLEAAGEIRTMYGCDATLYGAITASEIFGIDTYAHD